MIDFVWQGFFTKTPELEPRTHRSAAAKNNILSGIADNTERNII